MAMKISVLLRSLRVLVAIAVLGCVGCGSVYMQDRGNDAMDMLELGITTSSVMNPGIAAHGDISNVVGLGYSRVCGWYTGLGARQFGVLDLQDSTWNALVWGSDASRIGDFDPNDPHEAWVEDMQALKAEGKPLPTVRPRYNDGLVRMLQEGNPPPRPSFFPCNNRKHLHLGWIGVMGGLHPFEVFDFILGWANVDFMKDDVAGKPDIRAE